MEDETAVHIIATEDGVTLGCGRIVVQDGGAHLGRLAVEKSHRKKGIGLSVCQYMVDYCLKEGYTYIWLNSQLHAVGFYEKLGFQKVGDVFTEAGIPHIKMVLRQEKQQISAYID